MKKSEKDQIRAIAGHWIESIEPIPELAPSPFFKENLMGRINELNLSPQKKGEVHDLLFYRVAVAAIFLLLIINVTFIYRSQDAYEMVTNDLEQLVSEYENIETDTYSNYSLLAVESGNTINSEVSH